MKITEFYLLSNYENYCVKDYETFKREFLSCSHFYTEEKTLKEAEIESKLFEPINSTIANSLTKFAKLKDYKNFEDYVYLAVEDWRKRFLDFLRICNYKFYKYWIDPCPDIDDDEVLDEWDYAGGYAEQFYKSYSNYIILQLDSFWKAFND